MARLQKLGMIVVNPDVVRVKGSPMALYRARFTSLSNDTKILETIPKSQEQESCQLEALLAKDPVTVHTLTDLNKLTTNTKPTHHPVVVKNEIFDLNTNQDSKQNLELVLNQEQERDPHFNQELDRENSSDLLTSSQVDISQNTPIQTNTHSIPPIKTGEDTSLATAAPTEKILQEVKELIEPGKLNGQIRALVLDAIAEVGMHVVKDAIAAVKEYKAKQKLKGKQLINPVGTFRRAVTEQWQTAAPAKAPNNFGEWYELALKLDLVTAASDKPDITRKPSGVQCVRTYEGEWVLWDDYVMQYSLEVLQALAEVRRSLG